METSRDRLEQALARIADPAGEGARTYLTLYTEAARAAADAAAGEAAAVSSARATRALPALALPG